VCERMRERERNRKFSSSWNATIENLARTNIKEKDLLKEKKRKSRKKRRQKQTNRQRQ